MAPSPRADAQRHVIKPMQGQPNAHRRQPQWDDTGEDGVARPCSTNERVLVEEQTLTGGGGCGHLGSRPSAQPLRTSPVDKHVAAFGNLPLGGHNAGPALRPG